MYKNLIIISFLLFLGCKSKQTFTEINKQDSIYQKKDSIINKGFNFNYDFFDSDISNFKVSTFKPIYITLNGKDSVIIKEVVYEVNNKKETIINENFTDTTKVNVNSINLDNSISNETSEVETESYNFLESLVKGVLAFFVGPLKLLIPVIGGLIIYIIYSIIKNRKNKKNELNNNKIK